MSELTGSFIDHGEQYADTAESLGRAQRMAGWFSEFCATQNSEIIGDIPPLARARLSRFGTNGSDIDLLACADIIGTFSGELQELVGYYMSGYPADAIAAMTGYTIMDAELLLETYYQDSVEDSGDTREETSPQLPVWSPATLVKPEQRNRTPWGKDKQPDFNHKQLSHHMANQGGRGLVGMIPEEEAREQMAYAIALVELSVEDGEGKDTTGFGFDILMDYVCGTSVEVIALASGRDIGQVKDEIKAKFSIIDALLGRVRFWDNRSSSERTLVDSIRAAWEDVQKSRPAEKQVRSSDDQGARRSPQMASVKLGSVSLENFPNPDWADQALCAQTDPEVFFLEKGDSTYEAKKVCEGCHVRKACLSYALANDEGFGVWGGLSERERRGLKRRAV